MMDMALGRLSLCFLFNRFYVTNCNLIILTTSVLALVDE